MIILFEIFFIIILGCLLHFTYEWSHHNKVVGCFSAVNESTWEHIKLAVFPTFLTVIFDYWFLGENENYWLAKLLMMLFSIIMIPAVFYSFRLILKKDNILIDIMIFCLVVVYSVLTFDWVLRSSDMGLETLGIIGFFAVPLVSLVLTFYPMKTFLFVDPSNKKYGFDAHECFHLHKHKK